MASHGIARTSRTARTEEQRRRELDKIAKYRDLETSICDGISRGDYDDPALFQRTSKLLRLNPEYYTVWNVRRRCLICGYLSRPSPGSSPSRESPSTSRSATTRPSSDDCSPSSSAATRPGPGSPTIGKSGTTADEGAAPAGRDVESDADALQSELTFTVPLLLSYPKCYWIWKYRRWILEQAILRLPAQAARRIWEAELALDSKMLTRDQRNFHAWGYRRYVVAKLESAELSGRSMAEEEFAYTKRKIEENLSNFSAWHNRSQLILRILDERDADDATRSAFLDEELEYVRGGLNVDPEDQSLWYYHKYLISQVVDHRDRPTIAPSLTRAERVSYLTKEIEEIKDLLEDYSDVKWIYEALLQYSLSRKQLRQSKDETDYREDVRYWLEKLRELDPMQIGRWNDMERQIA